MTRKTLLGAALAVLALGGGAVAYRVIEARDEAALATLPPAERGQRLLERKGCTGCHQQGSAFRAPILAHLYGKDVTLASGQVVRADDAYLERSIVDAKADVVQGYQAVMPSFPDLTPDELHALIEAMK